MRLRLREARRQKFWTQAELSRASGLTEATISRLESGLEEPRLSTVRRLAEALGIEPASLVCDDRANGEEPAP